MSFPERKSGHFFDTTWGHNKYLRLTRYCRNCGDVVSLEMAQVCGELSPCKGGALLADSWFESGALSQMIGVAG